MKVISGCLLIGLLVSACTIQPKVELVNEQTALEKQLLGRYADLDAKALLVAPIRNDDRAAGEATAYERAVAGRAFRYDELDAWIKKGWLIEVDDGTIRRRKGADITLTGKLQQRFERLIAEENRDRATIIDYVIRHSADFHASDRASLGALFHRLRVRELPAGSWIQAGGRSYRKGR